MSAVDILGKTVAVGDHIVYSGPAGTGSSTLYHAVIDEFVPIVAHPNGEPGRFVRQDQLNKSRPTRFHAPGHVIKVRIQFKRAVRDNLHAIIGYEDWERGHSLTPGQAREFAKVEV